MLAGGKNAIGIVGSGIGISGMGINGMGFGGGNGMMIQGGGVGMDMGIGSAADYVMSGTGGGAGFGGAQGANSRLEADKN